MINADKNLDLSALSIATACLQDARKKEKTVWVRTSPRTFGVGIQMFVDECVSLALWYNWMKFVLLSLDVEVWNSWEKKLWLLLYLITYKTLKNKQETWIPGKVLAKTLNWPWILVLKCSGNPEYWWT